MKTMLVAAKRLGPSERQRDLAEAAQAAAAEARGRLLELDVEPRERRLHVEVDDRVEVQRRERDDVAKRPSRSQSIGWRASMTPRCASSALSAPSLPRSCLMPTAPTNGGTMSGSGTSAAKSAPARELEAVEQHGGRRADRRRDERARERDRERVAEPLAVERVAEDRRHVRERQRGRCRRRRRRARCRRAATARNDAEQQRRAPRRRPP